jgi:hypothetical protein
MAAKARRSPTVVKCLGKSQSLESILKQPEGLYYVKPEPSSAMTWGVGFIYGGRIAFFDRTSMTLTSFVRKYPHAQFGAPVPQPARNSQPATRNECL